MICFIYVECYSDSAVVEALGFQKSKIKHAHSKGNVCKRLERSENSVGIVDEDPNAAKIHKKA